MKPLKPSLLSALWGQQVWIYALLILAGIGLGMIKFGSSQSAAAFTQAGVEVIGEITHMSDYSGSNKKKTYRISYTFAIEADPYLSGEQLVSQSFYEAHADGGQITVRYLPDDPTQSVVDLSKLSGGFGITMLAALGLIISGGIGGYFAVRQARKIAR